MQPGNITNTTPPAPVKSAVPDPPGDPVTIVIGVFVGGVAVAILLPAILVIYAKFAPLDEPDEAKKPKKAKKEKGTKAE